MATSDLSSAFQAERHQEGNCYHAEEGLITKRT
jgi:hypothetical protein